MTDSQLQALIDTALALSGFAVLLLAAGCISAAGWTIADTGRWKLKIAKVAVLFPAGAVLAFGGAAMMFIAIR